MCVYLSFFSFWSNQNIQNIEVSKETIIIQLFFRFWLKWITTNKKAFAQYKNIKKPKRKRLIERVNTI